MIDERIEALFLANRSRLLAFIKSRCAEQIEEDLLHEAWLRLSRVDADRIEAPLSYIFRVVNSLIIDRRQQRLQAGRRDRDWSEATDTASTDRSGQPLSDRIIIARQTAGAVLAALSAEGERVSHVFRRHRIDGLTQREVAAEMGVSIGTVEGDLRRAYRVLTAFKDDHDEV